MKHRPKGQRQQRGFVQNEPFIILALFAIFCFILCGAFGAALHWAWSWRVIAGAALFGLGVGAFLLYVWVSIVREKRSVREQKEKEQEGQPHALR